MTIVLALLLVLILAGAGMAVHALWVVGAVLFVVLLLVASPPTGAILPARRVAGIAGSRKTDGGPTREDRRPDGWR